MQISLCYCMFNLKLSISFITLRIKSNFPNTTYKAIHDLALASLLSSPSLTSPSHSTFYHTEFPSGHWLYSALWHVGLCSCCFSWSCLVILSLFCSPVIYIPVYSMLFAHHHDHDCESCSVLSDSLWPHGLNSPWNSLGQNIRMGSLSHLQGLFPTQGSNPGLPHCRWILYQLSHKRNPRILEYVGYPFSWIFPTQELNWGLLHWRQILSQLSYQGWWSSQWPSWTLLRSSCLVLTSSQFLHL